MLPPMTTRRVPSRGLVGKLTGVFGVRGELKCIPTSLGTSSLAAGRTFTLGCEPGAPELRCIGARRHHARLLVSFEGIASPEVAREFVGRNLYGESVDVALAADEYLDADLVGMRLVDLAERELATVVAVQHFPAQDCLVVGPQHALVPLIKAFVRRIDRVTRTIVVDLPEGLLEG